MRARLVAVLLLPATVLAGCLATDTDPADFAGAEAPPLVPLPTGFVYACPAGERVERVPQVCASTLASVTEAIVEPFVVVHPTNPDVIAVGANVGQTTGAVTVDGKSPGVDVVRFDVYVSEDAGGTWRLSRLPAMGSVARVGLSIDPALAFDAEGTLHATGMARPEEGAGWNIFYTRSPDLGRTWSVPDLLAVDADNDRSWITTDAARGVYVPWGNPGRSGELAWSLDGGMTWEARALASGAETCEEPGPAVALRMRVYVPCTVFEGSGPSGVRLAAFEAQNLTLYEFSTDRGLKAEWPILVPFPDGSLILLAETSTQVLAVRSLDEGRTWTPPVDLRSLTALDDAWVTLEYQWAAADPWGALHVLLKGGTVCSSDTPGLIDCEDPVTVHLALDPAGLRVLTATRLTPAEGRRVPPSLATATNFEYDGLAFGPERGVLVWTFDNGLDYTLVEPVRSS